jgi:hypothetical protein
VRPSTVFTTSKLEKITIPYNRDEISSARYATLRSSFRFDCTCDLCSLSPAEIQHSDARSLRIKEPDEAIGNPASVMNTPVCFFLRIHPGSIVLVANYQRQIKALANCREMIDILQSEYHGRASPLDASLYYDAFQIAITHGDQDRASVFAER